MLGVFSVWGPPPLPFVLPVLSCRWFSPHHSVTEPQIEELSKNLCRWHDLELCLIYVFGTLRPTSPCLLKLASCYWNPTINLLKSWGDCHSGEPCSWPVCLQMVLYGLVLDCYIYFSRTSWPHQLNRYLDAGAGLQTSLGTNSCREQLTASLIAPSQCMKKSSEGA